MGELLPQVCPPCLALWLKATHLPTQLRAARLSRYRKPMGNLVSGHLVFPRTPSGMGNSLPHQLGCQSEHLPSCLGMEPIPAPSVLEEATRNKSGASQDRGSRQLLPALLKCARLTTWGARRWHVGCVVKRLFSTYTDGSHWPTPPELQGVGQAPCTPHSPRLPGPVPLWVVSGGIMPPPPQNHPVPRHGGRGNLSAAFCGSWGERVLDPSQPQGGSASRGGWHL